MTKKTTQKPKPATDRSAYFEDNNGGDIIEMRDLGDGTFTFSIGYQCVYAFSCTGTVSEIAKAFAEKLYGSDA